MPLLVVLVWTFDKADKQYHICYNLTVFINRKHFDCTLFLKVTKKQQQLYLKQTNNHPNNFLHLTCGLKLVTVKGKEGVLCRIVRCILRTCFFFYMITHLPLFNFLCIFRRSSVSFLPNDDLLWLSRRLHISTYFVYY